MQRGIWGAIVLAGALTASAFAADSTGGGRPSGGSGGGGPGGKGMQPPQEAIMACSGKSTGDSCQAGQAGAGVCEYTPDKKYFACRPNNMPSGKQDRQNGGEQAEAPSGDFSDLGSSSRTATTGSSVLVE